jgi:hypothetical protein
MLITTMLRLGIHAIPANVGVTFNHLVALCLKQRARTDIRLNELQYSTLPPSSYQEALRMFANVRDSV